MGQAPSRGRPRCCDRRRVTSLSARAAQVVERDTPLVGWRYWQISGSGRLRSVTKKWIEWAPGEVMRSVCLEVGHAAPDRDCNCGLYGIDGIERLRQHGLCLVPNVAIVCGRVALWGKVIDDDGAWRGEFARPVALSLVTGTVGEVTTASVLKGLAVYGVPVDTIALAEAVAGVSAAVLGFQAMSAQTNRWAAE